MVKTAITGTKNTKIIQSRTITTATTVSVLLSMNEGSLHAKKWTRSYLNPCNRGFVLKFRTLRLGAPMRVRGDDDGRSCLSFTQEFAKFLAEGCDGCSIPFAHFDQSMGCLIGVGVTYSTLLGFQITCQLPTVYLPTTTFISNTNS